MTKKRVGVLRGGPSSEYEVSLKTGATVLAHIPTETYDIQDIFISKDGTWHRGGIALTPHEILSHLDVVFIALHGEYGEDGKLQHLLELHKIPFTGSGSFASAIGMNKAFSKDVYKKAGIKSPEHRLIEIDDVPDYVELFRTFAPPVIVKPVSSGSSIGVTLVKDFASFEPAVKKAFEESDTVMLEEFIDGIEATVGVIDGFREMEHYALPATEIRPVGKDFFDYDSKYNTNTIEICPGNFTFEQKKILEDMAKEAHKALGLRHYSRSDFRIHPKRGIFILETNTLPGMTEASLFPKGLKAVGSSLSHFLHHIIDLALHKK